GKRVSKVAGTVNSTYLWDGENLAQETRGGTNYLYSYFGMNPIALTSGNSSQVLEIDLPGSVLGVVNSSGVEIARYITDDFGNLQNQSGNSPNPFLFAGSFFDCESGLYQMRGRYYDPLMGRFLTQDFGPGNPYSYCKNNPVSMVDPSGWMYMYRAAVLGGDQGTWRDALAYLINLDPDNPAVIIGYGYILGQTTISKLLDLTNTLVSPYVEVRQKILTAALFFLRMEAEGIFPYEDETNCCANFVSLVLRMAGIFRKNENYKYIGKLNDVNGLQGALYHKHGYIHSSDPKGPGDIIIFYKDYSDAYHHVGIYLGEGLYIGSNNYPGEEDPQWININPIWQMAENWYWW
ncbi:MAG: RHS repeat-associated core domain-containing protein, partial [Coprothermobacterota bacterium]|nr:RHS repeat-associated core domain-containing protein [Coprothermobacterota bacterium]